MLIIISDNNFLTNFYFKLYIIHESLDFKYLLIIKIYELCDPGTPNFCMLF